VRGKITILGPENGNAEVNADQFYRAFLAALDANGLALYESGNYLKIVDKRGAKQTPIPLLGPGETPLNAEQMVTAVFKVENVELEPLRGVLQQLVSKDGDTIAYPPETIIVNDLASNVRRLQRVVNQLDVPSTASNIQVIQAQYASAEDVAATIQKLFESSGSTSSAPATPARPSVRRRGAQAQTTPAASASAGDGVGPATLSQVIPDERTNKLIIVASPAALERIDTIVREVDIPISGEGRINVYYLSHANAEEMANTLSGLTQGGSSATPANRAATAARTARPGAAAASATRGGGTAELFSGEVKISPDVGT